MKYFRDQNNIVHAFDDLDPAQVSLMNELTANWTDITESWPPVQTLAEVQAVKLAVLSAVAAAAYVAGFSSSATGSALWYDSDKDTQSRITSAALLSLNETPFAVLYPNGITIRAKASQTANDSTKQQYQHTAAQIFQLAKDMETMISTVQTKLWGLQAQVNAATTTDAVNAIAW